MALSRDGNALEEDSGLVRHLGRDQHGDGRLDDKLKVRSPGDEHHQQQHRLA